MNDYLDIYCERVGPGMLAEPINLISNLALFFTVYLCWRRVRKNPAPSNTSYVLVALIFALTTSSVLFHAIPSALNELLDTLPILLFQTLYLMEYLCRKTSLSLPKRGALVLLFLVSIFFFASSGFVYGALAFAPGIIFLGGVALYQRLHLGDNSLLYCVLLFLVSLTLRELDGTLCAEIPTGLHFVWHLLNAGVFYLLIHGLTQERKQ